MICVFPDPYPDELLYSVCARYGALMQYANKTTATEDFFGKGKTAIVDLPGRINHLIRSIVPGHLYTADELINKHTLLPFYAPFLSKNRAQVVRDHLRYNVGVQVGPRITRTRRGQKANFLRYCPECAKEDREAFGETYWHRLHQLSGVEACHRHHVFLEDTEFTWWNGSNYAAAIAAEPSVKESPSRKLDATNAVHIIHTKIAQKASFIFTEIKDSIDCEILARRYRNLLLSQGLAYFNGDVRITELTRKIKAYFPAELLTKLGCELRADKNWVTRLLSKCQADDLQHPICHILLLIFLNRNLEEVFNHFIEYKPFGEGPWPCLNRAVDHYKEPRIASCRILPGAKKFRGKPRGIFSCDCGFTYARVGPDDKETDRFTFTIVQSYGAAWEARLRELWGNKSFGTEMIARELGVNVVTLKRRVVSMGLRFPHCIRGHNGGKHVHSRYKLRRESKESLLERKKKEWLSLISSNPQIGRAALSKLAPSLYSYLSNTDPNWLKHHLPPRKQSTPKPRTLDWAKEDKLLAAAVAAAIVKINGIEPPRRVTVEAIADLVGQSSRLRKHLKKMPRTASIIDSHRESLEAFHVRRVNWAEAVFRSEQTVPTKSALVRRAMVGSSIATGNEVVTLAVSDALSRLRSCQ